MRVAMSHVGVLGALSCALASACGFALSTSLQHRAAGTVPESMSQPVSVLRYVLGRPGWLLGATVGAGAFVLHAAALDLGAVALVQPLMVAGVVLAVPVRAALAGRRPSRAEMVSVSISAAGLATFVVVAAASPGTIRVGERTVAGLVGAGFLLATAVVVVSTRLRRAWSRAVGLGVASGLLFGLTAGLMKLVGQQLSADGFWRSFGDWPVWALAGVGCLGLALNQYAYRIAPLSASMPVVNVVDVLVALLFGWVVFGEVPAHGAPNLLVQLGALTCTTVGLRRIARAVGVADQSSHPVPVDHDTPWSQP